MLSNRLKSVLGSLISPFQSAFLSERIIFDNIFIAQEVVHAINHRKHEGLTAALRLQELNGSFRGISVARNAPPVSHLLFADDTLLFTVASPSSCNALKEALNAYHLATGQKVNYTKSSILFSPNTPTNISTYFFDSLGLESRPFINYQSAVSDINRCSGAHKLQVSGGEKVVPQNQYLLRTDAAINTAQSRMGFGVVVRDWQVVETDSKMLVDKVHNKKADFSALSDVVEDIRCSLSAFPDAHLRHINKTINCRAHNLARRALGQDEESCWNALIPTL
uniref:RNase H type-1 domain-containing protein n=1 Tax=Cannabis sativa TaxID=3483 RepID=A0A803Q7W3_CANSA